MMQCLVGHERRPIFASHRPSMPPATRRHHLPELGLLLLLAVAFRFFSFFPLVIDHDESTYIVIANELLQGKTYWVDLIDTKPPGVFLVYMGLIALLGKSVFLLRLAAALWVGLTAWGLFRLGRTWMPQGPGAWFGAVSFLVLNSLFTHFGAAPNTETFFIGFTVLAMCLALERPWRTLPMLLAGLALGAGIAIKQVVAFDALGLGLFLLIGIVREPEARAARLVRLGLMTFAALLPTAAIAGWYAAQGLLDTWTFYQFTVPGRYPGEATLLERLIFVADCFLRFAPLTGLAIYGWLKARRYSAPHRFAGLWLALATLAVVAPGNSFYHYFIQCEPPLALLAGLALHASVPYPDRVARFLNPRNGWIALSVLLVITLFFGWKDLYTKPDPHRQAMERIRSAGIDNPTIYTGDANFQILYFTLGVTPPLPYVHPSLLWEPKHRENFGMDHKAILGKVIADRPDFLVFDESRPDHGPFENLIEAAYAPLDTFSGKFVLYARR